MMWNPRLGGMIALGAPVVIAVVVVALPTAAWAGQAAPDPQVTFTKDIAPILQRSCQNCHRPNAIAPMSLIRYEEVRPWARAIRYRTELRGKPGTMPPWFIEKDIGIQQYKNDPSLSEEEVMKIATWVDNGTPRGNPDDMPPPIEFLAKDRWEIGEPDLILQTPSVELATGDPDWWGPIGEVPFDLPRPPRPCGRSLARTDTSPRSRRRKSVTCRGSLARKVEETLSAGVLSFTTSAGGPSWVTARPRPGSGRPDRHRAVPRSAC